MLIRKAYEKGGYFGFCVGQAQKWLNMALKYIYVFGEARLPGYAGFYGFCHVPIDNIVLNSPEFEGLAQFCEAMEPHYALLRLFCLPSGSS